MKLTFNGVCRPAAGLGLSRAQLATAQRSLAASCMMRQTVQGLLVPELNCVSKTSLHVSRKKASHYIESGAGACR